MVRKYLLGVAMIFGAVGLQGQESFFKVLGSNFADEAYHMMATSNGDFLITGGYERDGFDTAEVLVTRINTEGDTLWTRIYGSSLDTSHVSPISNPRHLSGGNLGFDIHEDDNGEFLIAGVAHLFGQGNGDVYVVKIDANGELLWSKTYGGDGTELAYAMMPMPDNGYVLAGLTESYGVPARGGHLLRIDQAGDTLWSRSMSNEFIGDYVALAQASNEDIFAAGSTFNGVDGSSDFRLTRMSSAGDFIWEKTYGGALNEFCTQMIMTPDSGLMLVGSTESFGSGGQDVYCLKLDSEGDVEWSKAFGGEDFDGARDLALTDNGDYVLTGFTSSSGNGNDDILVMKFDSLGQILWSNAFGGISFDYGRQIHVDAGGDLFVSGFGNSFDVQENDWFADNDVYFLRLDSEGNGECHQVTADLVSQDCSTIQGGYDPIFVSGSEAHPPPTLEGVTYLIELDACAPIDIVENVRFQIKLFPNPALNWLVIESNCGEEISFTLHNALGDLVLQDVINSHQCRSQVDVSDLPFGVYFIKAIVGGETVVEQVVIH